MDRFSFIHRATPLLLVIALAGCASTQSNKGASSSANSNAEKKISMAIGQDIGQFTITSQQKIEAPMGQDGSQYGVRTSTGKTFKCDIYEPSGFGSVVMWGMAVGSSAMCTDFTQGSKDQGKTNQASCNALLKAAGKC